ncbi:MAG: sigma-70 family RNA polymerase sigma factor [Hyphomicrobiaceae bacterium]|nr:sigma-70 family RNA polymerase sigma factor [Hyphomicrobiaceae bacterium]
MRRVSDRDSDLAGLMRSALRGDERSYKRVLEALAPVVRGMVRSNLARFGTGLGEVEDIVQETLLAVHLKRDTWDERLPLLPWVRAIAHNKLVDNLRRRGRRVQLPIDDIAEAVADERVPEASGVDAARLLATLKVRQREIVTAISIEGASAAEVAARLGMTENAVRVSLHRSLQALARAFRDKS